MIDQKWDNFLTPLGSPPLKRLRINSYTDVQSITLEEVEAFLQGLVTANFSPVDIPTPFKYQNNPQYSPPQTQKIRIHLEGRHLNLDGTPDLRQQSAHLYPSDIAQLLDDIHHWLLFTQKDPRVTTLLQDGPKQSALSLGQSPSQPGFISEKDLYTKHNDLLDFAKHLLEAIELIPGKAETHQEVTDIAAAVAYLGTHSLDDSWEKVVKPVLEALRDAKVGADIILVNIPGLGEKSAPYYAGEIATAIGNGFLEIVVETLKAKKELSDLLPPRLAERLVRDEGRDLRFVDRTASEAHLKLIADTIITDRYLDTFDTLLRYLTGQYVVPTTPTPTAAPTTTATDGGGGETDRTQAALYLSHKDVLDVILQVLRVEVEKQLLAYTELYANKLKGGPIEPNALASLAEKLRPFVAALVGGNTTYLDEHFTKDALIKPRNPIPGLRYVWEVDRFQILPEFEPWLIQEHATTFVAQFYEAQATQLTAQINNQLRDLGVQTQVLTEDEMSISDQEVLTYLKAAFDLETSNLSILKAAEALQQLEAQKLQNQQPNSWKSLDTAIHRYHRDNLAAISSFLEGDQRAWEVLNPATLADQLSKTSPKAFNAQTGKFLFNEGFIEWEKKTLAFLVPLYMTDLGAAIAQELATQVEEIQAKIAAEGLTEAAEVAEGEAGVAPTEPVPDQAAAGAAGVAGAAVPTTLEALVAKYQAEVGGKKGAGAGAAGGDRFAWWLGMTLEERKAFVTKHMDVSQVFEKFSADLTQEILLDWLKSQGLNESYLPIFEALAPQIQQEVAEFLVTLNISEISALRADLMNLPPGTSFLDKWALLRDRLEIPLLSKYRDTLIKTTNSKLKAERNLYHRRFANNFGLRANDLGNLDASLDSLIVLTQNPTSVIDGLNLADLNDYLGLELKKDQETTFKNNLNSYLNWKIREVTYLIQTGQSLEAKWTKKTDLDQEEFYVVRSVVNQQGGYAGFATYYQEFEIKFEAESRAEKKRRWWQLLQPREPEKPTNTPEQAFVEKHKKQP
jgi:hypothetical protein